MLTLYYNVRITQWEQPRNFRDSRHTRSKLAWQAIGVERLSHHHGIDILRHTLNLAVSQLPEMRKGGTHGSAGRLISAE